MGLFSQRDKKTLDPVKADSDTLSLDTLEKTGQEAFGNNPWVKAKDGHMGIYMSLATSASQWRTAMFVMTVLLALSVGCNIYLSTTVKVQPYVIQVDRHGYAIPVKMTEVSGVDQRVILSQVGLFIFNSRTRVMDRQAQLLFAEDAYRSVARDSAASRTLDAYFRGAPPTRAPSPVVVHIESVLPFSSHTYQAKWQEVTNNASGSAPVSTSYAGLFTVAISPPTDMENLLSNPMGIYVTDYSIVTNTSIN
jgi:type IV secretion system protein VirB5